MAEALRIDTLDREIKELVLDKVPQGHFDLCLTCGTCTGGCPASEQLDMDPRRLIRMLVLGLDEEIVNSDWKWVCSMCGRCKLACPMDVDIPKLVFHLRNQVPRDKRPRG
ncbi:MAG: 4Fe-4S dicluster domain-containing protein, partial [Desulfobacterales bacterium]|nr:4Fe-4S dicluster domain-containing protein [Desulfobacterales bacterium]